MNRTSIQAGCLLIVGLVTHLPPGLQIRSLAAQTGSPTSRKPDAAAAEQAIRASAQSFIESFNKGDAKALAAHWTSDGVYINEDGERFPGRKSIQQEYQTLFQSNPDVRLLMEIDSIRLINAETAIEEGRAALGPQPPGEARVMSRYTAVHVKQDGKWLMADVRDTREELPPDAGQLEDLEAMVGSWSAGDKDAHIDVKCRWIEDRHFLARSHQVTEAGNVTSTGLEIIGLDPSTGRITSWSFTSDGGHAVGIWAPHENGWIVETAGVMKDGTPTSATNILSRKDKDTLLWKSGDRMLGDELLPDTQDVAMKRQ
jgi:uncharacterized protein (TIGR02246 family)